MAFKRLYYVIRILDEQSVMLNCGLNQGITCGDLFRVLSKEQEKIVDPFSNKTLGIIQRYKAKLEVVEIYENMCICQNARKSSLMGSLADATSALTAERRLDLNVDPSQITGNFKAEDDEMIQIGDEVESIECDYLSISREDCEEDA